MRQLFTSVIVPKMLYAVDVWGAEMLARQGDKAGSTGLGRVLERVLRSHALTSTGAMNTTSTEVAVHQHFQQAGRLTLAALNDLRYLRSVREMASDWSKPRHRAEIISIVTINHDKTLLVLRSYHHISKALYIC